MAKKDKLTEVAVKIGTAVGKADRAAHLTASKLGTAGAAAKKELADISKQIDALAKQLAKTKKNLQKALK
jgi:hypothetical protein